MSFANKKETFKLEGELSNLPVNNAAELCQLCAYYMKIDNSIVANLKDKIAKELRTEDTTTRPYKEIYQYELDGYQIEVSLLTLRDLITLIRLLCRKNKIDIASLNLDTLKPLITEFYNDLGICPQVNNLNSNSQFVGASDYDSSDKIAALIETVDFTDMTKDELKYLATDLVKRLPSSILRDYGDGTDAIRAYIRFRQANGE